MKQHITREDLNALTDNQKQQLRDWWKPQTYDLCTAYVCTDASIDNYEYVDFVVGEIIMDSHFNISLMDLKTMGGDNTPEAAIEESPHIDENVFGSTFNAGNNDEYDDESPEDQLSEDENDFDVMSQPVSIYDKKECLPVLNIGQMIGLLKEYTRKTLILEEVQNSELFSVSFYYKYDQKFEAEELCDCLWEAIKEIL